MGEAETAVSANIRNNRDLTLVFLSFQIIL